MSMTSDTPRTYQLAAPDRTGAMLGLSHAVVVTVGTGLVVAVLALSAGSPLLAVAALAVSVALVAVRRDGGPLVSAIPNRMRWAHARRAGTLRWQAPLPLSPVEGAGPPWPPCLDGQDLLSVAMDGGHGIPGVGNIAVVHDRRAGTVSATVSVLGRHFGLVDGADQDSVVDLWGRAIAAFVREQSPVVAVRANEWAAPAGIAEHLSFVAAHDHDPTSAASRSYRDLVAEAGPLATRHEVLVTVTVGVGLSRKAGRDALGAAVATLGGEIRQFDERLRNAGLSVSAPLDVGQLARATRCRLDPTVMSGLDRRNVSLGRSAGLLAVDAGPLSTDTDWMWWRADGSYHRCFYVSDWPQLPQPAYWLNGLLSWAAAVRSLTVVMEPVSPRESRDAIKTQATKLESDRLHREKGGYRVGAEMRRAAAAVEQREEEIVSGYREFTYAGIVTVSASTLEELDRAGEDLVQVAGGLGMEIRALHGRHDQAFAVCLPLGRALAPPRKWKKR
jgi:hypothetical protein